MPTESHLECTYTYVRYALACMYVILAYCKLNVEVHCPKQVYVEPPPSPLDMTLPAFAAEPRCPQQGARSYRLISAADAGAQQQTCRPPSLLTIDGTTDRRTDAQPLHIDPASRTMRAASIIMRSRRVCVTVGRPSVRPSPTVCPKIIIIDAARIVCGVGSM